MWDNSVGNTKVDIESSAQPDIDAMRQFRASTQSITWHRLAVRLGV